MLSIQLPEGYPADLETPVPIRVASDEAVFTRLMRESRSDDSVYADPLQLGFFFVDNWWRLRWECAPARAEISAAWRMRHELSSISGYAWPRLAFWGDGNEVWLSCTADPAGIAGPVRYLTNYFGAIPASNFESEIDRFVSELCAFGRGMGGDFEALQAHFDALNSERSTVEAAAWRKLEAQCGFDVDSGPEQMIEALLQLLKDYPGTGVNEAALATQGLDTATVLQEEIEIASQVGIECNFSDVLKVAKVSTSFEQPAWVEAEEASDKVRAAFDLGTGPVSSMKLAEVMHATPKSIVGSGSNASGVPKFGLRCGKRREDWQRITLQSRRTEARRFEMARALGDVLGYAAETLGPLTSLRTHRQQFQRAFAQALLCPFEGLMTYINTEQPRAEDVEAAARHFKVGEAVVLTVLVNKDVISRQRFEQMRADRSIGLYG